MKYWFRLSIYLVVAAVFGTASAGSFDDFFRAVARDDPRTVGALLERGFDPNALDDKGQLALVLAIKEDSPKVVAVLLNHPAIKVDEANANGETALMMAALKGNVDLTKRLLERGGAVNRAGWTPLHYAASGPEPALVALLLDRGAAIDAPSPNRSTPLMLAAGYGSIDAADLLLARGADARLRNDKGIDAAEFARRAGRDALAARLTRGRN